MTADKKLSPIERLHERVSAALDRPGYPFPDALGIGWTTGVDLDNGSFRPLEFELETVSLTDFDEQLADAPSTADVATVIVDVFSALLPGVYTPSLDSVTNLLSWFSDFDVTDGPIDTLRFIQSQLVKGYSDKTSFKGHRRVPVIVLDHNLSLAAPDTSAQAWLRLMLLSSQQMRPNSMNLDGIFGKLPNVVWTDKGPVDPELWPSIQKDARRQGARIHVLGVDKFPQMLNYVVPEGVRIANADRVRLGAHLAEGTTVMHEGFCNFNAGTLGASMVEGRISAGVVVGDGSDVGGGASIMGTLSGGGKEVISVGERCLIGANAGIGISLGDNCVVAAGCYVTAGSLVADKLYPHSDIFKWVKARELSGINNLTFLVNSKTGQLEARPRDIGDETLLNEALHTNN